MEIVLDKSKKIALLTGSISLALAVMIGAFGAHGLKELVIGKFVETYKTGVTYHYYHGFGLLFLGLLKGQSPEIKIVPSTWCFIVGTLLFSFNCYFYAMTKMKVFAMIVPLGGVLFIAGWIALTIQIHRKIK